MPRVVPTDVVDAIDRMFPEMGRQPNAFPNVGHDQLPLLAALVRLVESVPNQLIVLKPRQYAGLTASVSCLQAMADVFQASRAPVPLRLRGFDQNPIAMIRAAMEACPDEAPSPDTAALDFIVDQPLRDSIRLDISAAYQDEANGQWKGATVLAGSAAEALLLWAIQEHETKSPGALATASSRLVANKNPEKWDLYEYIEVASELKIIKSETAIQLRQAKNFRNLIHPGRAQRLGQTCDRATALAALSAVEFLVRDLTP